MNRIKDLRTDADLKQSELAERIKVTQKNISDYETEKTEPTQETWIKLADFFKVPLDYLMGRTQNQSTQNFLKDLTDEEIQEVITFKNYLKYKRTKRSE